jgi:general secretion pathway protein E
MTFFDSILRKKTEDSPPPKATLSVSARLRVVAPAPPAQPKNVTPLRQQAGKGASPVAPAPVLATPVYRVIADLPPIYEVVSLKGEYAVAEKARETVCVLRINGSDSTYAVLATKDHFNAAAYIGLVERIKEGGGTLASCGIIDGPLLQLLYKGARKTADNVEEANKPIMRDIDNMATEAIKMGTSDIHIEKRSNGARVLFRVHQELELWTDSWDADYVMRMARALHTSADEDSKDVTFSEDGAMSVSRELKTLGIKVKLRVQLSPAYPDEGIDIVIRILRVAASAKVLQMRELGYAPEHIEMFEYMMSSPGGLTVVSGTTNSGKSTTLQTAMTGIRKESPGKKLISIEDPPEYVIEGVTQIPVARRKNAKEGDNPFASAMRNTMRMDPDVIMVGEVRDSESAELLVGMVQSGHKALTTIHTESGLGIVGRLRSMGVESDVLGARNFISGLIFQTLVRVLCKHCKVDYDPSLDYISPALHERIKHVREEHDTIFVEAVNTPENKNKCPHCKGRGITGLTVCAEMVVPDAKLLECIRANDMTKAHEHWRSKRKGKPKTSMIGATALEHGLLKMRQGLISPREVESALGLLHDFTQDSGLGSEETLDLLGITD